MITIKPSLMDEWWVNFTMSLYEQGWLGMSFEKQLVARESELNRYHVTYDIHQYTLTFESEAYYNWFILRWS